MFEPVIKAGSGRLKSMLMRVYRGNWQTQKSGFYLFFLEKLIVKHLLTHTWAKSPRKDTIQIYVNYDYNQSGREKTTHLYPLFLALF